MGARFVLNIPQAQESFCTHPMEVLGDVGMSNLVLDCLETVLVSVQDRCMVCAKGTIGSEIILDAPYGTLDHEAQVDARFIPFGDSVSRCKIGPRFALNVP
jgi:hypothetical protein